MLPLHSHQVVGRQGTEEVLGVSMVGMAEALKVAGITKLRTRQSFLAVRSDEPKLKGLSFAFASQF